MDKNNTKNTITIGSMPVSYDALIVFIAGFLYLGIIKYKIPEFNNQILLFWSVLLLCFSYNTNCTMFSNCKMWTHFTVLVFVAAIVYALYYDIKV